MNIDKLKDTLIGMTDEFDLKTLAVVKAARLSGIQVIPSSAMERGQMVLLISPSDYDKLKHSYEVDSNGLKVNDNASWEDWATMCRHIKTTHGADKGWPMWLEWSQQSKKYDANTTKDMWDHG